MCNDRCSQTRLIPPVVTPMHHDSRRIAVINPNSNAVYTENISKSLEWIRRARDVSIECITLQDAPLAIQSDEDIEAVVRPICETVENLDANVAGLVIACFADPGLQEARRVGSKVVVGSCEAAVLASVKHGRRLGLISTGDDVDADRELVLSYSSEIDFLEIESLGIPTAEIPVDASAMQKIVDCGRRLQAQGVDVVMLGCAGMAAYGGPLQAALGIPVIESVSAGVELLLDSIEVEELRTNANH